MNLGMRVPPKQVTESAICPLIDQRFAPWAYQRRLPCYCLRNDAVYQALRSGNSHALPWSTQTVLDARRVRSGGFTDLLFKKLANRGLGLIISGDESRSFRGFGKTNSPEAFGSAGAGGQQLPGHDRGDSVRQGSEELRSAHWRRRARMTDPRSSVT